MDIEELKENFLISMGCRLANNYQYINDGEDHDYLKKYEPESYKIGKYIIPFNYQLGNTTYLKWDLQYANLKLVLEIREKMLETVQKGYNDSDIAALGDYTINAGKAYITDFLKYYSDKLKTDEKITKYLISLSGAAITTLNNEMIKIMDKYKIKLSTAHIDAANYQNQLNQQTAAEAATATKYTTFTTTYYESWSGWNDYALSYGTTRSSMSEADVNASFAANASLSAMLESSGIADAGSTAIKEIGKLVDAVTTKFNDDLSEILVFKLKDLFNKDAYNHVKDVEKNPIDFENWTEILESIKEEDFDNLTKVGNRYGLTEDFKEYFENVLYNGEYNYYLEAKKCDYNDDRFKIFEMLSGNKEELDKKISDGIYNYYKKQIDSKSEKYEVLENEIKECSYMLDSSKTGLIDIINQNNKNHKKRFSESIGELILSLVLLFPVYKVHAWIHYMYVNDIDEFKTDIHAYPIFAALLYIPIAVISIGIICYFAICVKDFIKSIKK